MELFEHYSGTKFNKDKCLPIENIGWVIPSGGYWGTLTNSDFSWNRYIHMIGLSESMFPLECEDRDGMLICHTNYRYKTTFALKDESRIYRIETLEDLQFLTNKYPAKVNAFNVINYEKLVKSGWIDAIYFDHNMSHTGMNQSLFIWMYTKGCDMILVLNPDSIKIVSEEAINNTMNE